MPNRRHEGSHAPTPVTSARRAPELRFRCHPDTPLPWFLIGCKTSYRFISMRPPAAAAAPRPAAGDRRTEFLDGDFGRLEGDITAAAEDLRAILMSYSFRVSATSH